MAISTGGGIDTKKTANEGINKQARVRAFTGYMRGELTAVGTVNMPADITEHMSGPGFAAALIPDWASICHGEVEGVSGTEAQGGVGVRGVTDSSTNRRHSMIRYLK